MKEKYLEDLSTAIPIKTEPFNSRIWPTSDLDSYEVLSLAKQVSNWRNYTSCKDNNPSFRGTLDEKSNPEIFTEELYKKLNLKDTLKIELRFELYKRQNKKLFKKSKENYFLFMHYSCHGDGGIYKGNLIKKLYSGVQNNS